MSMRRIAELAGVSKSTVSLALANSPTISEPTKQRVLECARQLGYRRDTRLTEVMSQLRVSRDPLRRACLGLISLYDEANPWARSEHSRRIYEAMKVRADFLGYRMESLWLRAPGMTNRRFRGILDARGIEGLLCFGSSRFDEKFPAEFDRYAVVTVGLSIKTPLHRVVNDAFHDTWRTLAELYDRGYRKPGLVLSHYEDERSGHACSSAYYGWADCTLGWPPGVPALRLSQIEEKPLLRWLEKYSPDVVIIVHFPDNLREIMAMLQKRGIRVPQDLGVAAFSQILEGSSLSGIQEDQALMGSWAVELLGSRIANRDFGIPEKPRIEMVQGRWIEGTSLRPRA